MKPTTRRRKPYQYHPVQGEINLLPSTTVPDQHFTVREILDRFQAGLSPVGAPIDGNYYGDTGSGIDPRTLDISERVAYYNYVKGLQTPLETQQPTNSPVPASGTPDAPQGGEGAIPGS